MRYLLIITLFVIFLTSCAGNNIFSAAPTSTSVGSVVLPNPVSVKTSTVTGKIYVVNSNGRVEYNTGSFAQLTLDATDTSNPALSADKIVSMDEFGGDMVLDAQFAYVSNRKSAIDSDFSSPDHVFKLEIDDGSLSTVATATVGPNPFGIALNGANLFVVSDNEVDEVLAADMSSVSTIDLSNLSNSVSATSIEGAAIDTTSGWLFVSNDNGDLLVIDTTDNSVDYEVEGPNNTTGITFGNGRIYVLESSPASLLILDASTLQKQTSTQLIDDSTILVGTIPVGTDPCQVALDLTNSRAYVSNVGSDNVSVIDTDLLQEIDRISLDEADISSGLADGHEPCGLDVGTFNGVPFVIVANYDSNNVSVINGNTLKVVATFP